MNEDTNATTADKMVGAKLPQEYRDMLARIQKHYGRTFTSQLKKWIELETTIIERNA